MLPTGTPMSSRAVDLAGMLSLIYKGPKGANETERDLNLRLGTIVLILQPAHNQLTGGESEMFLTPDGL